MTFWKKIVRVFDDLFNSLKTTDGGFSARKLSAFFAVGIAGFSSVRFGASENIVNLAGVWLLFALLCLGLVTAADLIAVKTGTTKTITTATTETKTTGPPPVTTKEEEIKVTETPEKP